MHTDETAAYSANSVNALSYTVGNNIVFGQGQYQPNTLEGRRLLAHELTHVIQQSNTQNQSNVINRQPPTPPNKQSQNNPRPDFVFIMGEDTRETNKFYEKATAYFQSKISRSKTSNYCTQSAGKFKFHKLRKISSADWKYLYCIPWRRQTEHYHLV